LFATFLGSDPITVGATVEQKKKWLGRIADEGILFAYGATEPEAGSDLGSLKTTADRVEKEGRIVGYKINGAKQWISNGGIADAYTVLANTPAGPSWFIVDKGVPGFNQDKPEDKHGIRLSNTAALAFNDVYVDADRLIGGVEGQGLLQAQAVFGYTRVMVAAFGLGAGWAALDRAIPYSAKRIQGGTPLSEKQGYTHKLIVPNAVRLEAGRAFIEETAERIDAGTEGSLNTEGAIAKYMSTEAGNAAAEASIQALGGYGYTHEYMVEKISRDVRITTIYEGTSEIMEMTISRDRWQLHLKTRGQHYHDYAHKVEALHAAHPNVGADVAALALHALAEVMEKARANRLTRHQHILLRLGEWIAYAESAATLARRAALMDEGRLNEKASDRFDAKALAVISRIFAREAALKVAQEGMRWIVGAGGVPDGEVSAFEAALGLSAIRSAQTNLLSDMDYVADVLYGRAQKRTTEQVSEVALHR
jgi:alkylation response protein AidB-like acyl-CoA dehydrogenase